MPQKTKSTGVLKKFYDIHCHAMNLSHPNLLAFLRRVNFRLLFMLSPVLGPLINIFGREKTKKIYNLLSVMENDISDFFLLMEYYLKKRGGEIFSGKSLKISGQSYDKIVLTPLMMDFGFKNIKKPDIFHNLPPQKPIVEQVVDIFNSIKKYMNKDLRVKEVNGVPEVDHVDAKGNKILEIYPFLGLNTKNYDMARLEKMLSKYFDKYRSNEEDLLKNMGRFKGDIEKLRSNFFAGIKIYPPLGFDPWPIDNKDDPRREDEQKKAEYLYAFCCKKNIPVTVHSSDGGFAVDKNAKRYTSPKRWRRVLEKYGTLKINFAHLAKQGKRLLVFPVRKWEKELMELINEYPNVYTDFSCNGFDNDYYEGLDKLINKSKNPEKLVRRILFGTDFMINLLWMDSYNQYLEVYSKTRHISGYKEQFCSVNSREFLYG